jgi:hypothetical protein
MAGEFVFGPHGGLQVGDIVEVSFNGAVTREHIEILNDRLTRVIAEEGRCFLLGDMARASTVDAEARRSVSDWHRNNRLDGMVAYNAGFAIRTVANLTASATRLLGGRKLDVQFFREEADARRWLAERRATVLANSERNAAKSVGVTDGEAH